MPGGDSREIAMFLCGTEKGMGSVPDVENEPLGHRAEISETGRLVPLLRERVRPKPSRSTRLARISIRTISTWTLTKPLKIPKSTVELALAPVCPGAEPQHAASVCSEPKPPSESLKSPHLHGGLGNPEWQVQHRGGEAELSYRESVDATITRVIHFSSAPWLNSLREGT